MLIDPFNGRIMRMNRNVNINLLFHDNGDAVEDGEAIVNDSDDDNADDAAFETNDDDDHSVDGNDDTDTEYDNHSVNCNDETEHELSQFEFSV